VIVSTDYARVAYEGFSKQSGGRTYDGRPLPKWEALPGVTQVAWLRAATEVLEAFDRRKATKGGG